MISDPVCNHFDAWFARAVGAPTAIQRAAWPVLRDRRNALLLAPTGRGKTLAAWRPVFERLARSACGRRAVRALHIAPLKALARDVAANLQPIAACAGQCCARPIAVDLRCGDTPADARRRQRRQPPAVLCTTPETLFVLLGSAGGRSMLAGVETVVVDEWHALAESKRGQHLLLSLARLDALCGRPVQRIGLSATARPAQALADHLCGGDCEILEPEPPAAVELRIERPAMALGPYPTSVHWQQVHQRIAEQTMAEPDASVLVFCQTRAQVERSAAALDAVLAEAGFQDAVGAHHGSLDASHRETIEARFKAGQLRVLVSSASLELGLDLGRVDRVCQLGVPGSVNLVRQRAGRSRHRPGETPRMTLFALTVNQWLEAHALLQALRDGVIENSRLPTAADDLLAQQLVAMVAAGHGRVDDLLEIVRRAWPWREADCDLLETALALLAQTEPEMPGPQAHCLIERTDSGWRARADCEALVRINAGTIPEFFEYDVRCRETGTPVGRLDEEFAFESSPGQVIQLGQRAWRILRVETGRVWVEPVEDSAMELPFWFGEGRGRSAEMVDRMLAQISSDAAAAADPDARRMLTESARLLGALPSVGRLVIECFPDPGGDRHLVLHTFAGARINRAWGLALRKRFCRQFNFELQAAATDDGILISLGVTSRFELAEVVRFVRSATVEEVLVQALLDTPLFLTRFRWCANNALKLLKNDPRGRRPAQRQRSEAENLVACVFPDQLACLENLSGPREVPDHPLVRQALDDCLRESMDVDGLKALLARIECGDLEVHAVTTDAPSPLADALIHAPRFSFLDEAAAEERRTRAFEGRTLFKRTPRADSTPAPVQRPGDCLPTPQALAEWLDQVGFLTGSEGERGVGLARPVPPGGWSRAFARLVRERRAVSVPLGKQGPMLWMTIEHWAALRGCRPSLACRPHIPATMLPAVDTNPCTLLNDWTERRSRIAPGMGCERLAELLGLRAAEHAA
ncbi:MAG: DEAD/DEAH box helicase [Wenzhouxiangellaceae bacterium]|nr:DEAD/DEAH box helicase [Wenzhouxiangellaceae bacterium]